MDCYSRGHIFHWNCLQQAKDARHGDASIEAIYQFLGVGINFDLSLDWLWSFVIDVQGLVELVHARDVEHVVHLDEEVSHEIDELC